MKKESTPLADIMIEYGEAMGKAEERKRVKKNMNEIAEEHPDMLLIDTYPLLQKKLDKTKN